MDYRKLRKSKGLTQYDLEFESGISQSVISRIEKGQQPTEFQKKQILKVLQ